MAETIRFLRQMHRSAPFLFFNGITFAELGRMVVALLFADLRPLVRREVSSAAAHCIAGVLDEESFHQIIESAARDA